MTIPRSKTKGQAAAREASSAKVVGDVWMFGPLGPVGRLDSSGAASDKSVLRIGLAS